MKNEKNAYIVVHGLVGMLAILLAQRLLNDAHEGREEERHGEYHNAYDPPEELQATRGQFVCGNTLLLLLLSWSKGAGEYLSRDLLHRPVVQRGGGGGPGRFLTHLFGRGERAHAYAHRDHEYGEILAEGVALLQYHYAQDHVRN